MIIYTAITDGYEKLPDNNYYDPHTRYVCFYDGELEKKGPWEFIHTDVDIDDPWRRAHYVKIHPYKYFNLDEQLLWVDGGRVHTPQLHEVSKRFFSSDKKLGFLKQKYKYQTTFLQDIENDYFARGNVTPEEIVKYATILKKYGWSFYRPTITNFGVWMNGIDKEFCDLWWELLSKGPQRDMISMMVALELSGIDYASLINFNVISQDEKVYKVNRRKDYYWKTPFTQDEVTDALEYLRTLCQLP